MSSQEETHAEARWSGNRRSWGWYAAAVLLFGLAIFKFAYQDIHELNYPLNDLTTPWVSANAFVHGHDPYLDMAEFNRIWTTSPVLIGSGIDRYEPMSSLYPMAYPPTTMVLLAPLGLMSWHATVWVMLVGATGLFVLTVVLLARRLQVPWRDPRRLFFCGFALAMAPLHSGIHQVNLNTLVLAFIGLAMCCLSTSALLTGIALGLAICLKPQVAILFLVYLGLRRKWKAALWTVATGALVFAAGSIWMLFHHIHWLTAYRAALAQFSLSGGANSFSADGVGKFQLLNLQVLVFQLVHSVRMTEVLSWAMFALLAGVSAILVVRRVSDCNESVGLAIVSVLTLLPVYERFYTAAILVFVLAWAVQNIELRGAKAALVLMLPFLFPFGAWAERSALVTQLTQPDRPGASLLLNGILLPQAIWIELILLGILLWELWRRGDRGIDSEAHTGED